MISTIITATIAIATGATPAAAGPDLAVAKSWVSLVDAKDWDESWSAAGTLFKSQMPQARWALTIQPVRDPLGAVSSRSVKSVTKAKSLPGAPDGQYEVVQFQTSFTHKIDATETIVLAREPSGWKVDGYFIR
jgi:Protein of unknown function (DUF4019)